jgi:hypothetical protein
MVLTVLPTAVIVACEVVALVLIIGRSRGLARTLGAIGMVILIVGSLASAVYFATLPLQYQQLGSATAMILMQLRSFAAVGFAFTGLVLVAAAVIIGSRRAA